MTERGHAPDAVDATGKLIADCYCPRCDHFSGGGLCRVCRRELAIEEQEAAAGVTDVPRDRPSDYGQRSLL